LTFRSYEELGIKKISKIFYYSDIFIIGAKEQLRVNEIVKFNKDRSVKEKKREIFRETLKLKKERRKNDLEVDEMNFVFEIKSSDQRIKHCYKEVGVVAYASLVESSK
jgi:hypothetical protein